MVDRVTKTLLPWCLVVGVPLCLWVWSGFRLPAAEIGPVVDPPIAQPEPEPPVDVSQFAPKVHAHQSTPHEHADMARQATVESIRSSLQAQYDAQQNSIDALNMATTDNSKLLSEHAVYLAKLDADIAKLTPRSDLPVYDKEALAELKATVHEVSESVKAISAGHQTLHNRMVGWITGKPWHVVCDDGRVITYRRCR